MSVGTKNYLNEGTEVVMPVATTRFGERLAALRRRAKLTQESLAKLADLTVSTVRKLEQTDAEPSWATAKALAVALGVSLDELAEGG
jgi:transcriptional regulator with XRE-family HTH domain